MEQNSLEMVNLLLAAGADVNQSERVTFQEGMRIEGNYRGRGRWLRAKIRTVKSNNTYTIDYDDGETELGAREENIRLPGEGR